MTITPETLAWLRQSAAVDGAAYSQVLLHLLERVEALEAKYETQRRATLEWGEDVDKLKRWSDDHLKRIMALEQPKQDKLDRLIALDRDNGEPAPASAQAVLDAFLKAPMGHSHVDDDLIAIAAALRAVADQVDAVNVPDHIRGDAYWSYRNGRAAAKAHLIAIADELEGQQ